MRATLLWIAIFVGQFAVYSVCVYTLNNSGVGTNWIFTAGACFGLVMYKIINRIATTLKI